MATSTLVDFRYLVGAALLKYAGQTWAQETVHLQAVVAQIVRDGPSVSLLRRLRNISGNLARAEAALRTFIPAPRPLGEVAFQMHSKDGRARALRILADLGVHDTSDVGVSDRVLEAVRAHPGNTAIALVPLAQVHRIFINANLNSLRRQGRVCERGRCWYPCQQQPVDTAQRIRDVVQLLVDQHMSVFRARELARRTSLDQRGISTVLRSLQHRGIIEQDAQKTWLLNEQTARRFLNALA